MFIHNVSVYRWSAQGTTEGTVQIKGDAAALSVKLTPEEIAQIEAIATAAYERSHRELVAEISKPLETNLIAAPAPIQDADFDEVPY
jgi:hypothetical protein